MASRFMTAAAESYRALGMGKNARPLDYSLVGWNEAVPAVALLLVSQGVIIAGSLGNQLMDYLPLAFSLGIVTLVTFAAPFAVVTGWAYLSKQPDRLPLLVMFVAIVLFFIQVVNLLLSYLGLQTTMALIAVTAVFVGRSIRTVLGASILTATLAGLLVGIGMVAAGLLVLVLPIGQATVSLT